MRSITLVCLVIAAVSALIISAYNIVNTLSYTNSVTPGFDPTDRSYYSTPAPTQKHTPGTNGTLSSGSTNSNSSTKTITKDYIPTGNEAN